MSARIAVFASGGGSNLQTILDHFAALGSAAPGEVVLVASDKQQAGALDRARARGVAAVAMSTSMRGQGLGELLDEHHVDLIALAGYLRLIPADVTRRFRGRMVNVHPALLPAFGGHGMYGLRVHRAVIESGARVSGVTVHFVDEVYDHGPIVAQWPVPVFSGDTAESLAARVLEAEHVLYPRVVAGLASGRIGLDGDRPCGPPEPPADGRHHFSLASHSILADAIDEAFAVRHSPTVDRRP